MRLVLVVPPTGKVTRQQRIVLDSVRLLDVGGASDCMAPIDDPSVGAARLRLEWQGPHLVVRDVEALGKCFAGGLRLRARVPRIVGPFTVLHIGDVACRIELDSDAELDTHATRSLAFRFVDRAAERARDRPVVRVAEGAPFGEAVELDVGRRWLVGRGSRADLFLDDLDASREHASVEWRDGRVLLTDLGSRAGSHLGGVRLEPRRAAVWEPGRMAMLGPTVLLLEPTARQILAACAKAEPRADGPFDAPAAPGAERDAPAAPAAEVNVAGANAADARAALDVADERLPSEASRSEPPPELVDGSEAAASTPPSTRGAAAVAPPTAPSADPALTRRGDVRTPRWVVAAYVLLAVAGISAVAWLLLA